MSSKQAIVIGAGLGGLAAALRLRARGLEVTVVERQEQPGGRAAVYRRGGFTFDAGPTIITAPFLIDELFSLFGKKREEYVTLRSLEPWYRIRFDDGESLEYSSDLKTMVEELERFEVQDGAGYQRMLRHTEKVYQEGFERLGDQPFHRWSTMLKVVPSLGRLRSDRSVYRQTAHFIQHPKLRQALSFHPLLVGGSPFTTTSIYSLIHHLEREGGVHFAMGGTTALVQGFVRLLEEEGVKFRYRSTVKEIVVEGPAGGGRRARAAGVELESGEVLKGDLVVANADAPFVYRHLVPAEHRRKWTTSRIDSRKYSMGLFVLYFGSRRTYPHLAHHEILLGPRYQGLIEDIFENHVLAEDMSLYLHAPTRTDPSLAPEGCESMYALVPVPNLKADIDWKEAGPRLRDRLVARLSETVCPGLEQDIVEDFYVTPENFRGDLLSHFGAGFSVQPVLTQSAWFRFHNRSEELRNLYLVGAGTHPGAGVPGVLSSAKVMERLLDEEGVGSAPLRTVGGRSGSKGQRSIEEQHAHQPAARAILEDQPASELMARRAKTFWFATRLMPRETQRDVANLYRFCRVVDDLADDLDDPQESRRWLQVIEEDLNAGKSSLPSVASFLELARRHSISREFARELVRGLRLDLGKVRIQTQDELIRYCYQVASTVGVMMCRVLGTQAPDALLYAIDLGIAMQLTNIARDVKEDLDSDRIYLPASWISAETVEQGVAGSPEAEEILFQAVERLLSLAEEYYRSADMGMIYLPAGARWSILTAARSYKAIGEVISRRGQGYWQDRMFTRRRRKTREALRSLGTVCWQTAKGLVGRESEQNSRRRHQERLHRPLRTLASASLWRLDLGNNPTLPGSSRRAVAEG